jgi:hypothetical protein
VDDDMVRRRHADGRTGVWAHTPTRHRGLSHTVLAPTEEMHPPVGATSSSYFYLSSTLTDLPVAPPAVGPLSQLPSRSPV